MKHYYFILFAVALVIGWSTMQSNAKQTPIIEVVHDTIEVRAPEFTEAEFVSYIQSLNLKYPEVIVAQARLETGNYSSKVFQENNNLFGMKCASSRPHTHQGQANGHAKYQTWQESVLDYALFQASFLRKKSKDEYISYLNANYSAIGDLYGKRILSIANDVKSQYAL